MLSPVSPATALPTRPPPNILFILADDHAAAAISAYGGRLIQPGTVREERVLNLDFAPTFLDFAGAAIPADLPGRSFVPVLSAAGAKDWRRVWYYRYYDYPGAHCVQPHYGVRTDQFKLIYFNRIAQWELYDLQRDPTETNNVVSDPNHADQLRTLKSDLARLRQELDDHDQLQGLKP